MDQWELGKLGQIFTFWIFFWFLTSISKSVSKNVDFRNIAGLGCGTRGQRPPTNAHPFGGQIRGSSLSANSFPHGNPPMVRALQLLYCQTI